MMKVEIKPRDLGKFIHATMLKKKITYRKMREECGVTSATIIRSKNGENIPRIDTLEQIMDYFGYEMKISIRKKGVESNE